MPNILKPNALKQLARNLLGGRDHDPQPAADVCAGDLDVAVLDVGVLNELHATLGSDIDRVRGVYEKFLDSAAKRIDELRHQSVSSNLTTLHALKGSAGMVGASRLALLAERLHDATAEKQTFSGSIESMRTELATFHGVLEAQLDSLSRAR